MSIKATKKGADFPIMESGTFIARCYSVLHIGTVTTPWGSANKVRIGFEFPTEKQVFKEEKGEEPFVLSKEYTLSTHEKATLRHDLEGWRGKKFTADEIEEFEVESIVGVPAFVNVIHEQSKKDAEKVFANIASISSLPKGTECPKQINAKQILNYDEFNQELFEKLPDFLKDKIKSSDEYKRMTHDDTTDPLADDDKAIKDAWGDDEKDEAEIE